MGRGGIVSASGRRRRSNEDDVAAVARVDGGVGCDVDDDGEDARRDDGAAMRR